MTIKQYIQNNSFECNSYYKINPKLFNNLISLILNKPHRYAQILNTVNDYSQLLNWIKSITNHIDNDRSISEHIYHIIYDMHQFPTCQTCKKELIDPSNFVNCTFGYRTFCSVKCMANNKSITLQKLETILKPILNLNINEIDKMILMAKQYSKYCSKYICLNQQFMNILNSLTLDLSKYKYEYTPLEKIYWYTHNMKSFPKCLTCGKELSHPKCFLSYSHGFCEYCCRECMDNSIIVKQDRQNTCMQRFGVSCVFRLPENIEKTKYYSHTPQAKQAFKETSLRNWGVDHPMKNKIVSDKCAEWNKDPIKRYIVNQKIITAMQTNYGVDNYVQTNEYKQKMQIWRNNRSEEEKQQQMDKIAKTTLLNHGVECVLSLPKYHTPEITAKNQLKGQETKRRNGTFNTSKPEEKSYELLCICFSKENVIRQYHSEAYPFNCDFYIMSIDTYIECNFGWTHGGHWFNENDEDDLKKLDTWRSKKTKYYDNAIDTWTVRDVKKRKCAKDNNLNYFVFWKLEELQSWLASLN